MPNMAQRLRAFLREIGPGGSRTGAAVLLVVLTLLALVLVMILFNLVYAGREAAEQGAGEDQYTIASGPQPEDFPLIFDSEFTPADGRPQEIPGLSEMDVIGYLQYVPGTNFRCLGASPERRLLRRTCLSSSEEDPAMYEVTLVEDNPDTVLSVVATARDATDEEAAEVLGDVARLAVGGLDPLDAETWVERTICSGANMSPRVRRSGSTVPKGRGHWRSWEPLLLRSRTPKPQTGSWKPPRCHLPSATRQDPETPRPPLRFLFR